MIELAGQIARFLQAAAGCGILGSLAFDLIVATEHDSAHGHDRRLDGVLVLAGTMLAAGGLIFAAQLHAVAGAGIGDPAAWVRYALRTRFGATWLFQESVALLLFGALAARRRAVATIGRRRVAVLAAVLALLAVPASVFSGHGAADERPLLGIALNWIHMVAVGLWAGGLPALIALSWQAGRQGSPAIVARAGGAWRRFSRLALVAMACLIVSGSAAAWREVGGVPALLGTLYGQLLLLKLAALAAILLIAAHLRWRVMPRIDTVLATPVAARRLVAGVAGELVLVLAAIALASALAGSPPALHDQIVWPLSFRFAPEVAWPMPGVQATVAAGTALAVAGVFAATWRRAAPIRRRATGALLVLAGIAIAAPALTVPANPDTYRQSAIPYDVFSIVNGARLYRENCVICHGINATGDGEAAKSTARPPADLTAPHTRDHTAGDMFWWIGQGIPAGGMPGFAPALAEDERWDLVNFIHTLSSGYQARMIREAIAPRNPWLGAPDFRVENSSGAGIALQDFRRSKVVLLVLYSASSQLRLRALQRASFELEAAGARMIAVPIDAGLDEAAQESKSAAQIADAYMLFRRTLTDQRLGETGPKPRHMEMLIDLYGFIRARWVPEDGTPGWADTGALLAQVRALTSEGYIRDPPEGHLH
ncbi:MAG TPA: CopD family protein [Stellaceae bacterium]|nr:CopD family protein [Stellaceae bacterium]